MVEKVSHTSLATHSAPFALNGGLYACNCSGTIADGIDNVELQRLSNGSWTTLDPPIRFSALEKGGTRMTSKLPAGTYRWTVPGSLHNINVNVVGT
jgi:hypothetical protein